MSAKSQHNNILLAILGFVTVVVVVAVIGFFTLDKSPDEIQGEVEVTEYRVSSKVPGRILELRFKEGDYVKVGDTLAIIDAPELRAKAQQAQSAEAAAAAVSAKAEHGARIQQIQGAYQVWQQALAGAEIAKKSYDRVQRLFNAGVMTAQKRDEAYAQYKAMEAQEKAAKSQYELAKAGARQEDKAAAQAQVNRARGAIAEVKSYINETLLAELEGTSGAGNIGIDVITGLTAATVQGALAELKEAFSDPHLAGWTCQSGAIKYTTRQQPTPNTRSPSAQIRP